MRHGSLFSGIGGFDLAAEWMGWDNVFHCEINEFCQKILKYYWPNAKSYTNIKTTDFTIWRGKVDVISGGFPCQPFSIAGRRKGKADDRHLWPEMLRAITEIKPSWVVGENVPGILNWEHGMVFKEIKTDLENEGYNVLPPLILPACGKNAPHRRYRLWIIANANDNGHGIGLGKGRCKKNKTESKEQRKEWDEAIGERNGNLIKRINVEGIASNTKEQRLSEWNGEQTRNRPHTTDKRFSSVPQWQNFPTQSPVHIRDDGIPSKLDGTTIPKHRTESIKGAGNAIVPHLGFEIFKCIENVEQGTEP